MSHARQTFMGVSLLDAFWPPITFRPVFFLSSRLPCLPCLKEDRGATMLVVPTIANHISRMNPYHNTSDSGFRALVHVSPQSVRVLIGGLGLQLRARVVASLVG
jgi:hypothetical protein